MKDFVNADYISWLQSYSRRLKQQKIGVDSRTALNISKFLIKAIPNKLTADDLIDLLLIYTQPYKDKSAADGSSPVYGPINFYAKLIEWQTYLEKIKENHAAAQVKLEALTEQSPKVACLVSLLKEIMAEPRMVLHGLMPELLASLNNNLAQTLEFLSRLEAPTQQQSTDNIYISEEIFNSNQTQCISLLNKLLAGSQRGEQWYAANNLLQLTLKIYHNVHRVEINLEDDETDENVPNTYNNNETCTIL